METEFADLKPTTHIGILDHDLFPDHPEFYAKYLLKNVKDGHVYTDIFCMNVLSLNRIDLATEEDKADNLDYWAKVFKAETWEELKSLAERSKAVAETAEMMYRVSADVHEQSVLRAHRKYQEVYNSAVKGKERAEAALGEALARINTMTETVAAKDQELESKDQELKTKDQELETKDQQIDALEQELETLRRQLSEARK